MFKLVRMDSLQATDIKNTKEHRTFWYGVILSFGNKAKIIEPHELKERIIKTCKEIQMEYEDS